MTPKKKIKIIEIHANSKEDALKQIKAHVERLGINKRGEFFIKDGRDGKTVVSSPKKPIESPFTPSSSGSFGPEDIMKDLEKLMDDMEDPSKFKVVKSIPLTRREKELWAELEKVTEFHKRARKDHEYARDKFWRTVELRLGEFDKHLRYNDKTGEVEEVEEVEDSES